MREQCQGAWTSRRVDEQRVRFPKDFPGLNCSAWLYTGAVPMRQLNLKPTHKLVKSYYQVLGQFGQLNIDHEMAVRSAFQDLLKGHLIGQVVSVSLDTMKIVKIPAAAND